MVIRVAVVDDQELIRDGLAAILDSAPDVSVELLAEDGRAFVEALRNGLDVDVALVDIRMPRMNGLEAARQVMALPHPPAVVMLTTFDDDEYVVEALQAGAVGFILKRCTRSELFAAVRAAAIGDSMLSPAVTRTVIRRMVAAVPTVPPAGQHVPQLTSRERDVLRGIGGGLTNAEIAALLHLSESTVKTHVSNVLAKTASRDRVQAALLAVRSGLVPFEAEADSLQAAPDPSRDEVSRRR